MIFIFNTLLVLFVNFLVLSFIYFSIFFGKAEKHQVAIEKMHVIRSDLTWKDVVSILMENKNILFKELEISWLENTKKSKNYVRK